MSAEEKRKKFKQKAKLNKKKFETFLKLKNEFFKEVNHLDLKVIYEEGFIDDVFTLSLMSFAEAYLKSKLKNLDDTFPRYEDMPIGIQNPDNYKKVVEFWHHQTLQKLLKE